MTADEVFKFYRAYRLHYDGSYDVTKYHGGGLKLPPLIKQGDRSFYYRIAQKCSDAQIHALFAMGFFFNPRAHVSDLVSNEALNAALAFASRAENGEPLMQADLYELAKRLADIDLDDWLYGDKMCPDENPEQFGRLSMPQCLQDVIAGDLPLDVATVLLLVPQPLVRYDWVAQWQDDDGLGPGPWIARLKRLDKLIFAERPGWRTTTHKLSREFWTRLLASDPRSLAPLRPTSEPALF